MERKVPKKIYDINWTKFMIRKRKLKKLIKKQKRLRSKHSRK